MSILPKNISRRGFLRGGAVTAAGIGAATALSSCGSSATEDKEPAVVESEAATYVLGSGDIEGTYQLAGDEAGGTASLAEAGSWNIPLGCVLRPSEGSWKPYVMPSENAGAMTSAGVFSVANGTNSLLLSAAQSGGNYVIYDAQCSDSVFAWIELDVVTRSWKLFASTFSESSLGSAASLWEADSEYDPPLMCCSGKSVIWLVMPATSGSHTTEDSLCYLWKAGESEASQVVRSKGRFGAAPTVSDGVVTLVPRVRTSEGRYYGITAYTLDSQLSEQVAQLVLPASVVPLAAVYMGSTFVFSVEKNYSSGGLLGNMGTYIGTGDDGFIALPREPSAVAAGKDGVYLMKTRASHLIVDTNAKTYATLSAPNRSLDFGDYPASMGTTSTFVTFATVKDEETGYPSSVNVRAWSL